MKEVFNYLINPPQDKLIHFYVGTLLFLLFNIFFDEIPTAIIVIVMACLWEIYREWKYKYPINLLDVAFSIVVPIYYIIVHIVNYE